jgi:REP element-mobilizing transposase RayT
MRMGGCDCAQPGTYFVTLYIHNRECTFDDPLLCRVVETHWRVIPGHSPHATLDAWVVMPNHIHAIVVDRAPHLHMA